MKPRITMLAILAATGCTQVPAIPTFQPCVIPTPVPIAYPSGKRVVRPSFEDKQTEAQLDEILADGMAHSITAVFLDAVKFRVKPGQGEVRGGNGAGIVALNDQCGALASLNAILRSYAFRAIAPAPSGEPGRTEEQLEAEEKRMEAHADAEYRAEVGAEPNAPYDYPNGGSWALLDLEAYTAPKAKALVLALQKHPAVRSVTVSANATTGGLGPLD